jgi:hypothetical protein
MHWRGLRHWLRSEHLKQLCRMGLAGPVPSCPGLFCPVLALVAAAATATATALL